MNATKTTQNDTLEVGVGSSSISWTATITLDTGRCTGKVTVGSGKRRKSETFDIVVDEEERQKLVTWSDEIHARGDKAYREQFAQAGVGYTVTKNGERVESQYHLDGRMPEYEALYDIVRAYVPL